MKNTGSSCLDEEEIIQGLSSCSIKDTEEIKKECTKEIEDGEEENRSGAGKNQDAEDTTSVEEDEKIISLDWVLSSREPSVEYIPKGPIFRSAHDSHKYAPYERNDSGIPQISEPNDSEVNMNLMKYMMGYQDDGLYIWYDSSMSPNSAVVVPYLLKIDLENRKIGFTIPSLQIPDNGQVAQEKCRLFVKIYPNSTRSMDVYAQVENKTVEGKTQRFLKSQFISFETIKGKSGLDRIMSGLTKSEIDSAVRIVESKGEVELFKTYGQNKDTLLSMLCFSRDQSASNRAKVLALTRKILCHADLKYRSNLVFKNESDINALEFAATTNKADIAAYVAELFYAVGEDVLCTDSEGNTILHLLARKGDVVSPSLKALLELTLKNGDKMFPASVCNNLGQTPLHIAARGSDSVKTLQILFEAQPEAIKKKSRNESLPLHMACQYSPDLSVINLILELNSSFVNEVTVDGYSPLHLLALRGNSKAAPMDEAMQLEATKALVAKGADVRQTVSNQIPFDLVDAERVKVKLLLKIHNLVDDFANGNSPCSLSKAMGNLNSQVYYDAPPLGDLDDNYRQGPRSCSSFEELKLAAQGSILTSPGYSSGFESSPSSVQSLAHSKSSSGGTTPAYSGLSLSPTNTNPIYQYSPSNEFKSSEDEEEEDLDAIAQYLYQHPSIQNAVNMAEKLQ